MTPEYIINNWTDEKLNLMVEKLVERKKGKGHSSQTEGKVSDTELFIQAGNLIKVVKRVD